MYISAQTLNLKLKQDCSNFNFSEEDMSVVICDGIGEFPLSNIVAEKVCDVLIEKHYNDLDKLITDSDILKLNDLESDAGTTVIFCTVKNSEFVLQHLGNGGCIHCDGSFAETRENLPAYRFHEMILPHTNADGVLTKHLSKHGGKIQRKRTRISYQMNSLCGDIFLMFSDGINSLESNIIIQDEQGRYWRNESSSIMYILHRLSEFLSVKCHEANFQESLVDFNRDILIELKELDMLDDDSSLGIVISEDVLKHYKKRKENEHQTNSY